MDAPDDARFAGRALRVLLAGSVALALLAGLAGGLVRAGIAWPSAAAGPWLAQATAHHAFLMICAFMGTVIGIERAVALRLPLAYAAPLASGIAGGAALAGQLEAAAWLGAAGASVFVAVNAVVVRRQRAAHTVLLGVGAMAWAAGSLAFALGAPATAVVPWWFAFLVLTVAAERLEMTRLMRRRRGAVPALVLLLGALLAACALCAVRPRAGLALFGLSLAGLSLWLLAFDVARRTVRVHGLGRYMALCLLLGYVWLGASGVAWCAVAAGLAARDAALHGLAIGFLFSMMLGHAPVVLPALLRIRLRFGWPYYGPLVLLHGSLLLRLLRAPSGAEALAAGAAGHAAALGLFAAVLAASALGWRIGAGRAGRRGEKEAAAPFRP